MPDSILPKDESQFDTAEAPRGLCEYCREPIGTPYYRIDGDPACAACGERMLADQPVASDALFLRSVLYGVGASAAGLLGYALFSVLTGLFFGFAALVVGWMVSHAMLAGSGGSGSRRQQFVAVVLVYFAISGAPIPLVFYQVHQAQLRYDEVQHRNEALQGKTVIFGSVNHTSAVSPKPLPPRPHIDAASAVAMSLLLLFCSPFLAFAGGNFIGATLALVMLGVAMFLACNNLAGAYNPHILGPL